MVSTDSMYKSALQSFKLRTITIGIDLLDCIDPNWTELKNKVTEKLGWILPVFKEAVDAEIQFAIPEYKLRPKLLQTRRVTVTPMEIVARRAIKDSVSRGETPREITNRLVDLAKAIEEKVKGILGEEDVFLGGYSCLAQKGVTKINEQFLDSIPDVLRNTTIFNSSVNIATTREGIDLEAAQRVSRIVHQLGMGDISYSVARGTVNRFV